MQEEASGEDYNVEEVDDGPRPFSALLDTGLKRTSTGSKVFAALKVRIGSMAIVDLQTCQVSDCIPYTEECIHTEPALALSFSPDTQAFCMPDRLCNKLIRVYLESSCA